MLQRVHQRVPVGKTDVVPHLRIAGGDAGEVTEAAGGIAEDFHPLLHPPQHVHQGIGEHVRQMGGGGEHLVVMRHLHLGHR